MILPHLASTTGCCFQSLPQSIVLSYKEQSLCLHARRDLYLPRLISRANPAASGGSNYSVPVPGAAGSLGKENPLAGFEDDLSRTIVDCEVNADQWTLMHRYNKATELLEQALNVRLFCCLSPAAACPSDRRSCMRPCNGCLHVWVGTH